MVINNNLRTVRLTLGLSQEELATSVGTCGRTIGRIERGERNASLEMALRIAKCLDISVEDIFRLVSSL